MRNVLYLLFFPLLLSFFFFHLESCEEKERQKAGIKSDPHINKIFRGITVDSIEANLRTLRNYHTQDIDDARNWIYNTFKRYEQASDQHLQVSYTYIGEDGDSTEIVNIAAVLPGAQLESKERMYIVSGYYDIPQSENNNYTHHIPNTAIIMELVRAMSEHEFDATIVFLISMDREERRTGAAHFVKDIQRYNLHVAGMILNDIASRKHRPEEYSNEVRISVPKVSSGENKTTRYDPQSQELGQYFCEMAEQFVPYLSVKTMGGDDAKREEKTLFTGINDYPVVRLNPPGQEEGNGKEGPSEEAASYIDYNYLHQITKLNAAVLSTLANAPAGPKNVRADISRAEDHIILQWEPNDEPDLKGYEIVWRAVDESYWTGSEFVGDTTAFTLKGFAPDKYFIGVRALDRYDHKSPAAFPMSISD